MMLRPHTYILATQVGAPTYYSSNACHYFLSEGWQSGSDTLLNYSVWGNVYESQIHILYVLPVQFLTHIMRLPSASLPAVWHIIVFLQIVVTFYNRLYQQRLSLFLGVAERLEHTTQGMGGFSDVGIYVHIIKIRII